MGEQDLAGWLNNEINGYSANVEIPEYRRIPSAVRVNCSNPGWRATNHPIPLSHLTAEQKASLEEMHMREALIELEELAKADKIGRDIPMEVNGYLSRGLDNGFIVERAWCEANPASIRAILVQVRSRLLDFLLELKNKIGDETSEAAMRDKASDIDTAGLFNRAMFGSNTTIVIGHHNVQDVTAITGADDFDRLEAILRSVGISSAEINSLQRTIDAEKREGKKLSLGGRIGGWIADITAKAADGAMQTSVDQIFGVVVKAIGAYLGIPPAN